MLIKNTFFNANTDFVILIEIGHYNLSGDLRKEIHQHFYIPLNTLEFSQLLPKSLTNKANPY